MNADERRQLDRLILDCIGLDWMENSVLRAVAAAIRFEREACVAVVKAAQEAGRGLFDVYNEINARGDYWQVPDHHLKAPDGR